MSRDSRWALWPALVLLATASAIAATRANAPLFYWLNAHTAMLPDGLWALITTTVENAPAFTLLLLAARDRPQVLWAGLIAGISGGMLVRILKVLGDFPRPAAMLDPTTFHVIGPTLTHNAFPSGHSFTAGALAALLVFNGTKTQARWVLLGLAMLAAVSRVAVGAHWPIDVLVGLALGWLAGWGATLLARRSAWATAGVGRILVLGIYVLAAYAALAISTAHPSGDAIFRHVALVAVLYGLYRLYWLLDPASSRMR